MSLLGLGGDDGGLLGGGGGVLGGVGGISDGPGDGGILGGSGILGLPTLGLPSIPPIFPTPPASNIASSTSASNSVTLSSAPSSTSTSASSTRSTSSIPTVTSPTGTPTAQPDGSNGVNETTNTRFITELAGPSATDAVAAPHKALSFLQNKALSGAVFGLLGLLGLVLLIVLVTFALRRSRRKRLLDDAVSFDPSLLAAASAIDRYDGSEKGHRHSHEGSIGSGPGYGAYRPEPVPGYGVYRPEPAQYYEQHSPQPYYSPYVPPMTEARVELQSNFTTGASAPQNSSYLPPSEGYKHNIPRVPVPQSALPATFGEDSVDHDHRRSIEEVDFWAKTLKVTNK